LPPWRGMCALRHMNSIGKSTARYKWSIKKRINNGAAALPRYNLYFVLIYRNCDSHRFFILRNLSEGSLHRIPGIRRGAIMLDVILLALGVALFALSIGYCYACDRL